MKTADEILDCVRAHAIHGLQTHPDFTTPGDALDVIHDYFTKALNAAACPAAPTSPRHLAEHLAQVAGLAIKAIMNLELDLVFPPTEQKDPNAPLPPEPTPDSVQPQPI